MQHILILKIIISTTFLQFIIEISFLFIINHILLYIYDENVVNMTFLFNLTFTLKENLKELKHLKG